MKSLNNFNDSVNESVSTSIRILQYPELWVLAHTVQAISYCRGTTFHKHVGQYGREMYVMVVLIVASL